MGDTTHSTIFPILSPIKYIFPHQKPPRKGYAFRGGSPSSIIFRVDFKEPVCDAVVKLTEIVYNCGKEERRPIGHTFTDKEGEFVFGPLCPDRKYALQIWANTTKKIKVCAKCHHEGKCLKGDKCDKCDCFLDDKKPCFRDECSEDCKEDCCDK